MISTALPAAADPMIAARGSVEAWDVLREAKGLLARFGDDQRGATAIEYALMAMFFSVTVIGGSNSIRSALLAAFSTVTSAIQGATNG